MMYYYHPYNQSDYISEEKKFNDTLPSALGLYLNLFHIFLVAETKKLYDKIKQGELRKDTAILFFRNLGMQQKSWLKYPLNLHILLNLRIFYFFTFLFFILCPPRIHPIINYRIDTRV